MRWKWLLLLSLISISFVIATSDDESGDKVEIVNNDDDENYDEGSDAKVVEEEVETVNEEKETEPNTEENQPENNEQVETKATDLDPLDEDTVDVEPISVQKAKDKGKYLNYDDYMTFNLDQSDSNYDWTGECLGKGAEKKCGIQ
jgi:hypothetical protein